MPYPRTPLRERYERFVDRSAGPDSCWPWTGGNAGGYGVIKSGGHRGKSLRASRLAYEWAYGPIPEGLFVCHRCDNPPCVNPAHLFLGTQMVNLADMTSKGRRVDTPHPGQQNGRAKLTNEQALTVRLRLSTGCNQAALAREFGVAESTIYAIKTGRNWRCLDAEWGRRKGEQPGLFGVAS